MLQVLIADDEARICQLIDALTDWNMLDMKVVGFASNGSEALELIDQKKPDIVITDIQMPGVSGLELIRQCRQLMPNLEFVIISGYAHFEYAQTAIQYGVGDYLLKPIQKEELMRTLQKMRTRCLVRREQDSQAIQQRQQSLYDAGRLRESLVRELLGHPDLRLSQEQLERDYHMHAPSGYGVFLLQMDFDLQQFSERAADVIRGKTADLIGRIVQPLCSDLIFSFVSTLGCGICALQDPDTDALRQALREVLSQLTAQKSLYGEVDFSIASGTCLCAEDIETTLLRAKNALAERLVEGTGRLFEHVPPASKFSDRGLLTEYTRAISLALPTLDRTKAEQAALELRDNAMAVRQVRGRELLKLITNAGNWFIMSLDIDSKERLQNEFIQECMQCGQASRLFELLINMQNTLLQVLAHTSKSEENRPIRKVKQYIQKHFAESLTLEDVSSLAGFSASYFSALFKRETGQGFTEYLASVRMEHAKDLLRDTGLPVAEICRSVGYKDPKHFTWLFSHVIGLTPGEFRKIYG